MKNDLNKLVRWFCSKLTFNDLASVVPILLKVLSATRNIPLERIHGICLSHQTVINYTKTAATLLSDSVDKHIPVPVLALRSSTEP
jgi:hypothetical protein